MQIELDGTSNGTSGLKLTANGLALSDNLGGNGINLSSGELDVDLTNNSGLQFNGGQLQLDQDLAGFGLSWATQYSQLEIDTTKVVTSSNTITMKTGSSNLTLTATADNTPTQVAAGFTANLIDNPVFTYDLNTDITGAFSHGGPSFTIQGDFNVTGSTTVNGTLRIEDSFPLINSGNTSDAGLEISLANKSAYFYYDTTNERWGLSNGTEDAGKTDHNIFDEKNGAISTVQMVTTPESTLVNSAVNPVFGTGDASRAGQVIIKTNHDADESGIFIFA